MPGSRALRIAVCGDSQPSPEVAGLAFEVGSILAQRGAVLLCGGLGGVMAAAVRGARSGGGLSVGLLPGDSDAGAAAGLDVVLPTGLGEGRNLVLVRASHAVIAVGGGYGTLIEVAFALKIGRPVVGLNSWHLQGPYGTEGDPIARAVSPQEAVRLALILARESRRKA